MECCQSRCAITTVNISFSIILHFEKLLRKNNNEHPVNIRYDSAVLIKTQDKCRFWTFPEKKKNLCEVFANETQTEKQKKKK